MISIYVYCLHTLKIARQWFIDMKCYPEEYGENLINEPKSDGVEHKYGGGDVAANLGDYQKTMRKINGYLFWIAFGAPMIFYGLNLIIWVFFFYKIFFFE